MMNYCSLLQICFLSFSCLYGVQAFPPIPNRHTRVNLDTDAEDFFHYVTRPDIIAPKWQIWRYNQRALSPGYWFIAPYQSLEQKERGAPWVGPHIYDQNGELVWAGTPMFDHFKSFDLRVATVNGTDVMTVIYPKDNAGFILNSNYKIVKSVTYTPDFDNSNMHDFNVVQDGKRALVLTKYSKKIVSRNMAEAVGHHGNCSVNENGLKELDITGSEAKVVFAWNGTDHIGLDETTWHGSSIDSMCGNNWDIHHFNAIDQFPDGDYLLSSRHTDTLYKISHHDGSIIWRLGGVKSDFHLNRNARFTRQHHARVHSQNATHVVVSVFDNAKGTGSHERASHRYSRGLIISLRLDTMRAELVAHYDHPRGGITNSRGSAHVLPNNNVFMGWAYHTLISEHAPDGRILMEARLKKDIHTYRSYKYEWVGHPTDPPNVVSAAFIAGTNTSTIAYVSWNGATEVARWNMYETDAEGEGRKLVTSAWRKGFETKLAYKGLADYVIVEAVDHTNRSIGRSEIVQTIPPVENGGERLMKHTSLESTIEGTVDMKTTTDDSAADGSEKDAKPFDTPTKAETDHSSEESDSWMAEAASVLMNPIATFVTGFISCAVACGVFWAAWKYKSHSFWLPKSSGYAPLDKNNDQGEVEEGLEDVEELDSGDTYGDEK